MHLKFNHLAVKFASFALAFLYAYVFISVPMEGIMDRDNYLEMARSSPLILARFIGQGVHSLFANEPVWLIVNSALALFFNDVVVVKIIIFFSSFAVAYVLLSNNPKHFIFLILILLFPQILKNFVVHLRQGFAIAVFMIAWYSIGKKRKFFLIALTPFIHSSFFIIVAILVASWILKKIRAASDLKVSLFLLVSLLLSLSITQLASLIGARQAISTAVMEKDTSGIGFLFWLILVVIALFQGKRFIHKYTPAIGIVIFYLSSYFFTPVAGRVYESGVILVLLALIHTTGWRKLTVASLIVFFNISLMVVLYSQPMMGFSSG